VHYIDVWEPCYFAEVPDGVQIYAPDVLWLQEEGAQIHKKCGPRFHPLLHTYTID